MAKRTIGAGSLGQSLSLDTEAMRGLFQTKEKLEEEQGEKVIILPLEELHPFENHPFKVRDDDDLMKDTIESIKENGVLTPAIVRPRPSGGYEILSGHRRHRACQLAGLETIPVVVREMDDDRATIMMVDSNLQREELLVSERARAYQMKADALSHLNMNSKNIAALVGEANGDSRTKVYQYINLTRLCDELMQLVDEKKIAFTPALTLSSLDIDDQRTLLTTLESEQCYPSVSQAIRLKELAEKGDFCDDTVLDIMREQKRSEFVNFKIKTDLISGCFQQGATPQEMTDTIIMLLRKWQQNKDLFQQVTHPTPQPKPKKQRNTAR